MRGESGRVAARVRSLLGQSDIVEEQDVVGGSEQFGAEHRLWARPARGAARQRLRAWTQRWPVRLDPGRRAAVAVGIGVLVVAIATGAWVLADQPQPVAVAAGRSPGSPSAASTGPSSGASTSPAAPATGTAGAGAGSGVGAAGSSVLPTGPAALVVVDVAGKVRRPGLYRLASGSRVDDAVRAAGGALVGTNLTSLNLAAKVVDGQQIVVGLAGSAAPNVGVGSGSGDSGGSGTDAGGPSSSAPVDLNTAGSDQLQGLPGVGPVLAQHILDWRSAHGSFISVNQLNDVPGIGEVKFAALRSLVSV